MWTNCYVVVTYSRVDEGIQFGICLLWIPEYVMLDEMVSFKFVGFQWHKLFWVKYVDFQTNYRWTAPVVSFKDICIIYNTYN